MERLTVLGLYRMLGMFKVFKEHNYQIMTLCLANDNAQVIGTKVATLIIKRLLHRRVQITLSNSNVIILLFI